ncbi:MAG: Rid family detoxifying hydrolase [archaeon]|nr:Rid family detoxifying hydrolase [archaeon]
MLKKIESKNAPKAIGPYSQAILANGFVFVSGQLPIDPKTGELAEGTIVEQTIVVLDNLQAILKEAGSGLANCVKVEVFLANLDDFALFNEVYAKKLVGEPRPARFVVQAAGLPKNALLEVSVTAILP